MPRSCIAVAGAITAGITLSAHAQVQLDWESVVDVTSEILEGADDMAVDSAGNSIIVGYLNVERYPFVLKVDPNGTMLWSYRLEASALTIATDIVVDDAGDIYLSGRTQASDFPVLNAYQPTKNGPSDGFLMKLSGIDGSILFSTYFGGASNDAAHGIALGPNGTITIAGRTASIDLVTVEPYQDHLTLLECFCDDAFVTTFDADAQTVLYSTYFGGRFDDEADAVGVDATGAIVLAGRTHSDDLPMMSPAQATYGGDQFDGFVARLDGPKLIYSTYLGGEEVEYMQGLALGADGSAFVTGTTNSYGFPTTPGSFRENLITEVCGDSFFSYRCYDMFLTQLDASGALVYSTFLGGLRDDEPRNIALDAAGRAYVTGYTFSADFPMAPAARVVVARFNDDGSDVDFVISHATAGPNQGSAVAIRGNNVHVASNVGVPYDTYVAKYTLETMPGDTTGDGVVDTADLLQVLSDWGPCAGCPSDLDGDGMVGTSDLLEVLANWN